MDISQKKRQIISKLMKKSPSPRKRLNLKEGMKVIAEERKLKEDEGKGERIRMGVNLAY